MKYIIIFDHFTKLGAIHMTSALGGGRGVPQKQMRGEGGQANLDVIFRDD